MKTSLRPTVCKGGLDCVLKEKRIEIRVTPGEREAIRSAARLAGMSVSEFVVERCARGRETFDLRQLPGWSDGAAEAVPSSKGKRAKGKTEHLSARCTPVEMERIRDGAAKANLTLSDFIVESALGRDVTVISWGGEEDLAKSYWELRRQGSNLNQISHRMNRLASIAWRDDVSGELIDQLVRELQEDNERTRALINDAVKEYIETVRAIRTSSRP